MTRLTRLFMNRRFWFLYSGIVALALIGALALFSPPHVPVTVYKLCLLMLSALAGYCIDRALFPYAEPSSYLVSDWRCDPDADKPSDADYPVVAEYRVLFAVAVARQALLVGVSMMAVGLGL